MKPTLFARKPALALGYKVTEEHMEILADWCGGKIVPANPDRKIELHISVPTSRPSPSSLSQARVGFWILGTFHYRRKSFKVYNDMRLAREWVSAEEDDILVTKELEIPESAFVIPEPPACCEHCSKSTPSVPKQATKIPTPAMFSATLAS